MGRDPEDSYNEPAMTSIAVHPVAGALGAEISGVDLARDLSDEIVTAIRRAWLEHLVIFFRDQDLSPKQFLDFARCFGTPIEYPFVKGLDEFPEIIPVLKLEHERVNFGGIWHSDTAYLDVPPMASMLVAREVPPAGGDTLFANMYAAYEALSDGMKRMLEGLVAINSSANADVSRTREDRIKDSARAGAREEYVAAHPVVRVHPETGRRALYVNVAHTVGFEGMTPEESAPILDYLYRHQVRPEFTCRFRWRPGSLAFWDNRCAQHNAINDYQGHRRLLHRITLAGERPKGR
ncbi:MAG: taurine dioxygenase [Candidatus Rokuibacteriota bacterium]|nr:MAG: taurine dioxygenase [Candidatus Rokubacteria bacterium]